MMCKTIWTTLSILCFYVNAFSCNATVTTSNGQISISGLTANDNTKLFDADFNALWECNPWSSNQCTDETISDLVVGDTYFLSVVSDICEEWIPITVTGAPTTSACDINVIKNGNTINVTGLTADLNTKLFDADFNIIDFCNPWSGDPCGDFSVRDLAPGNYALSAVSDNCEEFIAFTIEGDNNTDDCQTTLEDWDPDCFQFNSDGSFVARTQINDSEYIENIYAANGSLVTSSINSFGPSWTILEGDQFITDITGSSFGVSIDADIVATYTTGNNFLLPEVVQLPNGDFYILGVELGAALPTTSGFFDTQMEFYIHQLDANGNELNSYNFDSFLYQNGLPTSDKVNVISILPLADGIVDVYTSISLRLGPANSFDISISERHRIDASFQNTTTTTTGGSNVNGRRSGVGITNFPYCDLIRFSMANSFSSVSGIAGNSVEIAYYDYSVAPPQLLYSQGSSNSGGVGGNFSRDNIKAILANGNELTISFSSGTNSSGNDVSSQVITITDLNDEVVFTDDFDVLPDYIIPTGGNNFNYIVDGVLFINDCDTEPCNDIDSDGICDEADCQPNNPGLPTAAGTPCDDFDASTINDIVLEDECTCAGELVIEECMIEVTTANGDINVTGMTTDANTKIFDADFNIIYQCNPWSGTPCPDNISTTTPGIGQYFLSVVSENCQEWIPITITVEASDAEICEVLLEDANDISCISSNDDGTFLITSALGGDNFSENIYANTGDLISTNEFVFEPELEYTIAGSTIDDPEEGLINIDPALVQLYSSDLNFMKYVTKGQDGFYYLIGGRLASAADNELDVYLHRLDSNGNEIVSTLLDSYLFEFIAPQSIEQTGIFVNGIGVDPAGRTDVYINRFITVAAVNTNFLYQVSPDMQSVQSGITSQSSASNSPARSLFYKSECGYYVDERLDFTFGPPNGNQVFERKFLYYDYSVSPRKFLGSFTSYSSSSRVGSFQTHDFSFPNGFSLRSIDYSSLGIGERTVTLKNSDGDIILQKDDADLVEHAFQVGANEFVIGSSLFFNNCNEFVPRQIIAEKSGITMDNVFPNPANQELFVTFESEVEQQVSIQVFDALNRLQSEQSFNATDGTSTMLLNTGKLNDGIYYLMMMDKNNNVKTKRFIKIRN